MTTLQQIREECARFQRHIDDPYHDTHAAEYAAVELLSLVERMRPYVEHVACGMTEPDEAISRKEIDALLEELKSE